MFQRKSKGERHLHKRFLPTFLLLTVLGGVGMPGRAHAEQKRSHTTVVYVMDQAKLSLRDADAAHIDQINYSFALIRDGKADGSHLLGVEKVKAYLQKHPHIRGVLAIGGWGADGFSDACATAEGRQKLADSLLGLMDEYGMRGVDIDWEYPGVSTGIKRREDDVENWYQFLACLRQGLDAREAQTGQEYVLSVALGAGENHIRAISPARLNALVDQAVVMAYDLCGFDTTTGHHAALYPNMTERSSGARAVKLLREGGLAADKLLMGFPAYGRAWRQVVSEGDGLGAQAGSTVTKVMTFDEMNVLDANGYTRYYDKDAVATYWYDGATFVSGEDAQSIREKLSWVKAQGLQGTAMWSYGQDESGAMMALLGE